MGKRGNRTCVVINQDGHHSWKYMGEINIRLPLPKIIKREISVKEAIDYCDQHNPCNVVVRRDLGFLVWHSFPTGKSLKKAEAKGDLRGEVIVERIGAQEAIKLCQEHNNYSTSQDSPTPDYTEPRT